jgi:diguanylate cyclase
MACDVGAHQRLVAGYTEQLTVIRQTDCDPRQVFEEVLTSMLAANAKLQERLETAEQKIRAQANEIHSQQTEAHSDALTGLANRRAYDQHIAECVSGLRDEGRPFCLLLLDIDNFKQFNDCHGHLAGDAVLRAVGRMLSGLKRAGDWVCRYGGEEFAVIMPGTTAMTATSAAERFRGAIGGMNVNYEGLKLQVTASVGVTQGETGESEAQVFRRADAAVYASKKAGRNLCHLQSNDDCLRIEPSVKLRREGNATGRRTIVQPHPENREYLLEAAFIEMLSRRIAETHRSGAALSLLHFGINDSGLSAMPGIVTCGVSVADALGGVIRSNIREMDFLGRIGDREFAVMLPSSSRSAAQIVSQRVLAAVASCPSLIVKLVDLTNLRLGIAELEGMDEPLDLLARAKADSMATVCSD